MKTAFSTQWKNSVQPRKQRKYRLNAHYHIKGTFMNAKLSKELRQKHGVVSARVRVGDKVRVMRGQFKKATGDVIRVDVGREQVFVSGVDITKKEGGKIPYPVHPSKLMITTAASDKRRFKNTEAKPAKEAPKTAAPKAQAQAQSTTAQA